MPLLLDKQAWIVPATQGNVIRSVTTIMAMYQPGAGPDHLNLLVNLVGSRGYTRHELEFAVTELAYDEKMNDKLRFNKPVTPADFERWIKPHRKHRAALKMRIPLKHVNFLLQTYPELDRTHFYPSGTSEHDKRLYRYMPSQARALAASGEQNNFKLLSGDG